MNPIVLNGKKGFYSFTPDEKSSVLRSNGKFSVIYKGKDADGNSVVIKMLHPRLNTNHSERKRFVKEFTDAVEDSFLPQMIDICESGQNLYIIREYIEGKDLSSWKEDKVISSLVKKEGKKKIALKVIDAFISLHSKKIIHGDIKPSNILLCHSENTISVRIIDFGLSIPFHHSLQREKENPLPWSFIYAPPELMLNYSELIHPASDIYSLSFTLYEFLTGEKPIELTHPALMMSVQLNQKLEEHSKINSETLRVLHQASFKFHFQKPIQNYPSDYIKKSLSSAIICRYQSMNDFKFELEKAFEKKRSWWKL